MKLDKQFLDDTMNSEREETALTIIKYLTKMLKHLGFKVLAEGVETKEQLDMLRLADFLAGQYGSVVNRDLLFLCKAYANR